MDDSLSNGDLREYLFWLVRLRRRFRISGPSMLPLLESGSEVLVNLRAYRHVAPCLGDVVVAKHPFRVDVCIIKRVVQVLENDCYRLMGDNPTGSTDSRSFGAVPRGQIMGRVTSRFL